MAVRYRVSIVGKRILLIDPMTERREVLSRRLRAQGYIVEEVDDAAKGADLALSAPPNAVIADLWMPSISGVQLCRLLRSEPATMDVPVILCGDRDEPRNHFWAERAGAGGYVVKGRTGELMRTLSHAVARAQQKDDGFFVQLSGGSVDIRDRIARHLDAALFESVIAAELRSLASAVNFDRLFDLLAQFMSQVMPYRWMALTTPNPDRLAIHHHPSMRREAAAEARSALGLDGELPLLNVEDEDAISEPESAEAIVRSVKFGDVVVARFALGPSAVREHDASSLASVVARELGGAIKVTTLVEESQRLAATDSLTGLMNRRAFTTVMDAELARCVRYDEPLSFVLLDIDHFKQINDKRGHGAGDRVIAALGALVRHELRATDFAARWGGEEFVVALARTSGANGRLVAERLRAAVEAMVVHDDDGAVIPVTASIGLSVLQKGEPLVRLVDRADRAMYMTKVSGRNGVTVCAEDMVGSLLPESLERLAAKVA